MFLTSTTRDATSSIIDDYNSFVQDAAAAGDADIQDYSHGFYAVASTADDDARDNTQTTYTSSDEGVPIYWLGGNKLADDYEDFYDGLWPENAEANPTNESGVVNSELPRPQFVWTGSADDGTAYHSPVLGSNNTLSRAMGTSEAFAVVGWIRSPPYGPLEPNPISGGSTKPKIDPYPLYALSLPFVVSATVVEPPAADELQLVDSVVTLELVTPLTSADQVVTISYDDPRLRDDTNVIEDLVGNDARSFTNRPVLNRFAFSPPAVEAPADWALIPPGLPAGAPFRLLFVTSGARDASSAYIEDYDDFVQSAAAAGHKLIRPYSDGFFALASTPDMDARDNTSTTGTGVPIYWLGGAKAADNYADFYDESWDDELNPQDEFGERRDVSARADFPWTGSNHNGTERVEANVSYGPSAPRTAPTRRSGCSTSPTRASARSTAPPVRSASIARSTRSRRCSWSKRRTCRPVRRSSRRVWPRATGSACCSSVPGRATRPRPISRTTTASSSRPRPPATAASRGSATASERSPRRPTSTPPRTPGRPARACRSTGSAETSWPTTTPTSTTGVGTPRRSRPTSRASRGRSRRTPTRPGRAATTTAPRKSAATDRTGWAATRVQAR